jgi:DNA-binding NarL/FixJ family response regulator
VVLEMLQERIQNIRKPTPRQLEILELAAHGYGTKQIADKLGIVEGTVKNITSNLFLRINAVSKIQAYKICLERGWLCVGKVSQSWD